MGLVEKRKLADWLFVLPGHAVERIEKLIPADWIFVRRVVEALFDRPAVFGLLLTWLWLLFDGASWWRYVLAVVFFGLIWRFFRDGLRRWRIVRRFKRGWRGPPPDGQGLASVLGLKSSLGAVPSLSRYEFGDGVRILEFSLVAGVTASDFEKAGPALASALGSHRCQITTTAPGWVRVRVVDRDSLEETRNAGWLQRVAEEREVDETLPDGAAPWWKKEEER